MFSFLIGNKKNIEEKVIEEKVIEEKNNVNNKIESPLKCLYCECTNFIKCDEYKRYTDTHKRNDTFETHFRKSDIIYNHIYFCICCYSFQTCDHINMLLKYGWKQKSCPKYAVDECQSYYHNVDYNYDNKDPLQCGRKAKLLCVKCKLQICNNCAYEFHIDHVRYNYRTKKFNDDQNNGKRNLCMACAEVGEFNKRSRGGMC